MGVNKKWTLPAHNALWKAHCVADGIGIDDSSDQSSAAEGKTATPAAPTASASAAVAVAVKAGHFYRLYLEFGFVPLRPIAFDDSTTEVLAQYARTNAKTEFTAFRVRGGPSADPASISMYTHRLAVLCACLWEDGKSIKNFWSADRLVSVGVHGTRYQRTVRLFTLLNLFATDSHMQLYGDGRFATTSEELDDPKHPNHSEAKRIRHACSYAAQRPRYDQTAADKPVPIPTAKEIFEKTYKFGITNPGCKDQSKKSSSDSKSGSGGGATGGGGGAWPDPGRYFWFSDLHIAQNRTQPFKSESEVHDVMNATAEHCGWNRIHPLSFGWQFGVSLHPGTDVPANGFQAFVFLNRFETAYPVVVPETGADGKPKPPPPPPPPATAGSGSTDSNTGSNSGGGGGGGGGARMVPVWDYALNLRPDELFDRNDQRDSNNYDAVREPEHEGVFDRVLDQLLGSATHHATIEYPRWKSAMDRVMSLPSLPNPPPPAGRCVVGPVVLAHLQGGRGYGSISPDVRIEQFGNLYWSFQPLHGGSAYDNRSKWASFAPRFYVSTNNRSTDHSLLQSVCDSLTLYPPMMM